MYRKPPTLACIHSKSENHVVVLYQNSFFRNSNSIPHSLSKIIFYAEKIQTFKVQKVVMFHSLGEFE